MAQDWPGTPIDVDAANSGMRAPTPKDYNVKARPGVGRPAPDEEIVFGGEEAPKTGFRYAPEHEAEIYQALRDGDVGLAKALADRYSDGTATIPREVLEQQAKWMRANPGASPSSINYSLTDDAAKGAHDQEIYRGFQNKSAEELRQNDVLPEGADAFARGAALGLDDEIDALTTTLFHGGSWEDNLARSRAIAKYDEENHPYLRGAGAIAGSLALPTKFSGDVAFLRPIAANAYREARLAGVGVREARAAAESAVMSATRMQLAKEGALYGGAIGAASGDTVEERLGGGAAGAALGATTGAVSPDIGRALQKSHEANLAPAVERSLRPAQEVGEAAARQGIDLLPADVGGPMVRRATSVAAQTIAGGQPIIARAQRTGEQVAARRDAIAESIGEILNPEGAGQRAIAGAKTARDTTRNEARAYYSGAEKMTEGFKAVPTKALSALDRHIAELEQTPGGAAGLSTLKRIREDLAAGKTTISGIRAMRSTLRDEFAERGLRGSDIERRVGEVVDSAAEDVSDSLVESGLEDAAKLFRKGDDAWRKRVDMIDNVFEPIIGTRAKPKAAEQVIKTLTSDLRVNNARAVKFLRSLPEETQNSLRASIIGALGRATTANQDEAGTAFSLATFLKNWNEVGETAKAAYFGPEARAALNDLARVARGAGEGAKFANRSNTGGVLLNGVGFGDVIKALEGAAALGTVGASVLGTYLTGRLLASPRFARWLARAPKSTLSPEAYLDRLSRIAKAEPAIANDVLGLQQRLRDAFSGSSTARLAADEPVDKSAGVPENQQQQPEDYPGQELPQ